MDWSREHALLRERGVELAPGLSDAELAAAEDRVGYRFPPDLRSFLQAALPRAEGMPDWRNPSGPGVPDWLEKKRKRKEDAARFEPDEVGKRRTIRSSGRGGPQRHCGVQASVGLPRR